MRLASFSMVFLGLAVSGCALQGADPQTSQVESALSGKWTEGWNPMTATNADIWPTTVPGSNPPVAITNTYVLIKGAPDDANGNPQFFGFVVWNGTHVGHVWRVKKVNQGNFRGIANGAFAAQQNGEPSFSSGLAGNVDGDPPIPRPLPTGDEWFIASGELINSKTTAQGIDGAMNSFNQYSGE